MVAPQIMEDEPTPQNEKWLKLQARVRSGKRELWGGGGKKGKSQKYVHKMFANIRLIKLKTNGRARGANKKQKKKKRERERKKKRK